LEFRFSRFSDYLCFRLGIRLCFGIGFNLGGGGSTLRPCRMGVDWSKEAGIEIYFRVGRRQRQFDPNSIYDQHQPQPDDKSSPSTMNE